MCTSVIYTLALFSNIWINHNKECEIKSGYANVCEHACPLFETRMRVSVKTSIKTWHLSCNLLTVRGQVVSVYFVMGYVINVCFLRFLQEWSG